MNDEDLEKTRALNELTDLINNTENNSSNIEDTKDANEFINIPDDINGEENKEELFNDLTNNNDEENKKNKKSIIKKFKEWI